MTVAFTPDVLDQAATASFTAFVSASPEDPMRMFSGLSDEVSFEDPVLPASPPENPEPQPVRVIAPARTRAPPAPPIAARVLCRVMSLLP